MCMRQGYPPVFLKPPDWPSPFLDDLIGKSLADDLRSLFGFHVTPRGPFGIMCGGDDSYLTSAFSSLSSLYIFVIAFGAGLLFRAKRRVARWLIALCVLVPILDTGIRVYLALQHEAGYRGADAFRATILHNLPIQMMANAFFQFALPFMAGLALALLASGIGRVVKVRPHGL